MMRNSSCGYCANTSPERLFVYERDDDRRGTLSDWPRREAASSSRGCWRLNLPQLVGRIRPYEREDTRPAGLTRHCTPHQVPGSNAEASVDAVISSCPVKTSPYPGTAATDHAVG